MQSRSFWRGSENSISNVTIFDHLRRSIFGSFKKRATQKRRNYSWERIKKGRFLKRASHTPKWPLFGPNIVMERSTKEAKLKMHKSIVLEFEILFLQKWKNAIFFRIAMRGLDRAKIRKVLLKFKAFKKRSFLSVTHRRLLSSAPSWLAKK